MNDSYSSTFSLNREIVMVSLNVVPFDIAELKKPPPDEEYHDEPNTA